MITKRSDNTRRAQRLAVYSAAGAAAVAQLGHGAYITGGPHTGTGTTAYGSSWTYNQTLLSSSTIGVGAQFRLAPKVDTNAGVGTLIRGDYRMIVGSGVANSMQFLALAPNAASPWRVSQFRVQAAGTANNLGQSAFRNGQMLAYSAAISAGAAGEWKSKVGLNFGEARAASWTNPVAAAFAPKWSTDNSSGSTTGYLGFRFQSGGAWLYGWMEIEVFKDLSNQNSISIRMNSWAYDNTGASVLAGVGGASAVPGGAGLAALAFGAAGLRGRRRSRN